MASTAVEGNPYQAALASEIEREKKALGSKSLAATIIYLTSCMEKRAPIDIHVFEIARKAFRMGGSLTENKDLLEQELKRLPPKIVFGKIGKDFSKSMQERLPRYLTTEDSVFWELSLYTLDHPLGSMRK